MKMKSQCQIYEEWQKNGIMNPHVDKPNIDKKCSTTNVKLARSQLSTLVSITTGHNDLSYHASVQDPIIDHMCILCGEER